MTIINTRVGTIINYLPPLVKSQSAQLDPILQQEFECVNFTILMQNPWKFSKDGLIVY